MLKADTEKKIKAVCVVHNETTTGVTSDIPEVRWEWEQSGGAVWGCGVPWLWQAAAHSERICWQAGRLTHIALPPGCLQVRRTMDAHNHPALLLVDGVSSIGALVSCSCGRGTCLGRGRRGHGRRLWG